MGDVNDFFAKKKKKGKKKGFAVNLTEAAKAETSTDHTDAVPLTVPVVEEEVEDSTWGTMEAKKKTVVVTGGKTLGNFESSQVDNEAQAIAEKIKLEENRDTFHSTRAAALEKAKEEEEKKKKEDEEKKKKEDEAAKAREASGMKWAGAVRSSGGLTMGWRERQRLKEQKEQEEKMQQMQSEEFPTLGGKNLPGPAPAVPKAVTGAWGRTGAAEAESEPGAAPQEEDPQGPIPEEPDSASTENQPPPPPTENQTLQEYTSQSDDQKPPEQENKQEEPSPTPAATEPVTEKEKLKQKFGAKKKKKKKKAEES
mmetsp:Transcript_7706/g.10048  ORF Transcript_7706/g.10048 Transcript_7706/m.10048 type:complete len:311 (-) Transcript_7706:329-1261(-)